MWKVKTWEQEFETWSMQTLGFLNKFFQPSSKNQCQFVRHILTHSVPIAGGLNEDLYPHFTSDEMAQSSC